MAKFNPADYEMVEDRLAKFWKDNPNGRVYTEVVKTSDDGTMVIVKAYIYADKEDINPVATGIAQELQGQGGFANTDAWMENCETSAIGRALANWNYQGTGKKRPSKEEMSKVAKQPTTKKPVVQETTKPPSKITEVALKSLVLSMCNDDKNFAKKCYDTSMTRLTMDKSVGSDIKEWSDETVEKFISLVESYVTKFKQEFEASFETTGNRAAYNFDRNTHCVQAKELSSYLWWGTDFNVDYMTAVLACQFTDGTIHYFDEIRLKNSNTEELAIKMKQIAPNIECYPDPAGNSRSTVSRRSDHQILRDHGFLIRAKKAHPSHIDRLNALNRKLKDAEGHIGLTVDPKCVNLIKDFEQCQRDSKGGLDKSQIELTHALDAATYAISYKFPIVRKLSSSIKW